MNTKLILPFLILLLSFTLYAIDKKGKTIRVLSYNIHHCNPPSHVKDSLIDVKAVAKVINEAHADLVALQELDVNTERSGKDLNEAAELARLTGMHFFFVKTIDYRGGAYGIGVLSRLPVKDTVSYRLPMKENSGGEPRAVAVVTVSLKGGKKLAFASTHFDLKAPNRILQAAEIRRIFKDYTCPVILAGDLNSQPESEPITELEKDFTRTCSNNCPFTIS